MHHHLQYKVKSGNSTNNSDVSFPDELNAFDSHFDRENNDKPPQAPIDHVDIAISVS